MEAVYTTEAIKEDIYALKLSQELLKKDVKEISSKVDAINETMEKAERDKETQRKENVALIKKTITTILVTAGVSIVGKFLLSIVEMYLKMKGV